MADAPQTNRPTESSTADRVARFLVNAAREGAGGQQGMPDHWIRRRVWYQLIVRLARPTLDWCAVWGASYAMGLGDILNHPMDNTARGLTFAFVGSLYGVRTFEKTKGVG